MTMMITKFHRLIESKLLWGIFLIVIIFSFVIWGTQMPSEDEMAQERSIATLDGKPVAPEDFRYARFNTYLGLVLQMGQPVPYTADLDREIEPIAWRRLVSLREARALDLVASDAEVVGGLEQQPIFHTEGRFDRERYRGFVQSYLPASLQLGLSLGQFEEHIREEISLGKLQGMVRETVLIPPYELKRRYHIYNDTYSIEYAVLSREEVAADVTVDDEQARAFFEQDPARFELPPKVAVNYVAFPVERFLEPEAVTDQEVQFFYDQNLSRWATTVTNTPAIDPDAGEDMTERPEPDITTAHRPLEEVRAEIVEALSLDHARYKAAYEAAAMIDLLTPDREGKAPSFEEAAQRFNLEIRSTEPLSSTDRPEEFGDVAAEFVSNAFLLNDHPEEYFSNPVEAPDFIYVLALKELVPARIPEFEEVRAQALLQARQQAITDALAEKARRLADQARAAEAPAFSELAEEMGLTLSTLDSFTASAGLAENPYAEPILDAVSTLLPGEISSPLPADDEWIVVRLTNIEPASEAGFPPYAQQVSARFGQQVASLIFVDWQDQLLQEAGFERREFDE